MPTGYVIVDARTVRGPGGREHDVIDAIEALTWTPKLCPLMRHEYAIWDPNLEWAWNIISSMLLARNPDSFRAYFRGYQSANRYWDAPDGRRYWRSRYEIDRGQPDGTGQRRVDEGARPSKEWDGPPHAPDGIGLYDQDERGRWWPTEAALASGFQPCSSCELTSRKSAIAVTPEDPNRVATLIATAEKESQSKSGRPLSREELGQVLRSYEDGSLGPYSQMLDSRTEPGTGAVHRAIPDGKREADAIGSVSKERVVRKLLELRAREAPLGFTGYKGVLSQKAIADVAGVPVRDVTKAAIAMDQERRTAETKELD
jgi:hypothetical protein